MAKVTVFDLHRPYDEKDLEAAKALGERIIKNYKLSAQYAGYMVPDKVLKTTPFWIFPDRNIDEVISCFKEALGSNPNLRFMVTKKTSLEYVDHLNRLTWEISDKIVFAGP